MGSEMCIRDRPASGQGAFAFSVSLPQQQSAPRKGPGSERGTEDQVLGGAVSRDLGGRLQEERWGVPPKPLQGKGGSGTFSLLGLPVGIRGSGFIHSSDN